MRDVSRLLPIAFHVFKGMTANQTQFYGQFSFVVGATIYIGGSNDKQKSYRGALIEREVLSNTTLSKVDHSERRPFFPFFQGQ